MSKILIAGKQATHINIIKYIGDTHDIITVMTFNDMQKILSNGYFDFILVSQNGDTADVTRMLEYTRKRSQEAVIIVLLNKPLLDHETVDWVQYLAKNVGIDFFVPFSSEAGEILNIAITSATTRLKQRELGPRFEELANKILTKLS